MLKLRLFILAVCSVMFLSSAFAVNAQTADLQTSTTTHVNLRAGPGTEWRILGVANPQTTIRLDGQAYGGSWVRGITSTGITGWMLSSYVNISAETAASLRQIWVEEPFTLSAPQQVDGALGGGAASYSVNTVVNVRSGPGT